MVVGASVLSVFSRRPLVCGRFPQVLFMEFFAINVRPCFRRSASPYWALHTCKFGLEAPQRPTFKSFAVLIFIAGLLWPVSIFAVRFAPSILVANVNLTAHVYLSGFWHQ